MGLAASQARFLGLTARKSNVEFQGQQINQARTALSNEVMGLYEKYNNLEVPTPPSVNDYQKTVYSVDNTYNDYRIDSFSKITEGEYAGYYQINFSCDDMIPKAYSHTEHDSVIKATKGQNGYSYLNFQFGLEEYTYDEKDEENSTIKKITGNYNDYPGLTTIMGDKTDGTYYMYVKNGVNYYTSEDDLDLTEFEDVNGQNTYYGPYTFDYQGTIKSSKNVSAIGTLTQDADGRLSTVQVMECEEDKDLVGNVYSISTAQESDQLAYDDAMNKYYYEKACYEQDVERINKDTKTIQEQDRSLELQLNQLDTEQKAISTEMESISKVIEKTIETVFKTYNS